MFYQAVLVLASLAVGLSNSNVLIPTLSSSPLTSHPFLYQLVPQLYPQARESASSAVTPNPLLDISIYTGRGLWDCNDLEKKINAERRRMGFPDLLCDPHMRYTANQHLKNAEEAGFNGFNHYDSNCNLHSWFGDYSCCYRRDHSNPNCMWDKPYELSKWDKRDGFEISAAHSAGMSPAKAFSQWKNSAGHYAVFIPTGSSWRNIKTVGCGWSNNLAHCWFAMKFPSTYN